jgi:hypothetical protein
VTTHLRIPNLALDSFVTAVTPVEDMAWDNLVLGSGQPGSHHFASISTHNVKVELGGTGQVCERVGNLGEEKLLIAFRVEAANVLQLIAPRISPFDLLRVATIAWFLGILLIDVDGEDWARGIAILVDLDNDGITSGSQSASPISSSSTSSAIIFPSLLQTLVHASPEQAIK